MRINNLLSLYALVAASFIVSKAEVRLPALISDNMVLQQNRDVKLWGWADPGETVVIGSSWSNAPVSVMADDKGEWKVCIKTPAASDREETLVFKDGLGKELKVNNILIGEVWHSAGQSNMHFPVGNHQPEIPWQTGMEKADSVVAAADYPRMRLFNVKGCIATDGPKKDVVGKWVKVTPESVYDFSAVAYIFGNRIHRETGYPVGVINTSIGATLIESWTDPEIMEGNPIYDYAERLFGADHVAVFRRHDIPGALWNGMIAPIAGYTIRGNIWYQGCGNAGNYEDYPQMFANLVNSWRKDWEQPEMPFYYVQIAPFKDQPAGIREAQLKILNSGLKNLGMAVTADCGDSIDIHPRNKILPGERLALWALNKDYGSNVEFSGPLYKSVSFSDGKAVISFDYADKGLKTNDDKPLVGFKIAGSDGIFHNAKAEISGNNVIVYSPEVSDPVAVRYGFENFFRINLCGENGLPASPFRTDNFKLR